MHGITCGLFVYRRNCESGFLYSVGRIWVVVVLAVSGFDPHTSNSKMSHNVSRYNCRIGFPVHFSSVVVHICCTILCLIPLMAYFLILGLT